MYVYNIVLYHNFDLKTLKRIKVLKKNLEMLIRSWYFVIKKIQVPKQLRKNWKIFISSVNTHVCPSCYVNDVQVSTK